MIRIARPCICLVSDRGSLAPDARTPRAAAALLERFLAEAIEAGIDLIQIRERDLEGALLRDLTRAAVARSRGTRTAIVVNDRVDVALAARAHGVHLRSDAPPTPAVRGLVGEGRLIGRSIHVGDAAAGEGANYLLFGPVFESVSKPGRQASGVSALAGAVQTATAPVLAIGGITPDRARACAAAGAAGVAAISLFLPSQLGVRAATLALRRAFEAE